MIVATGSAPPPPRTMCVLCFFFQNRTRLPLCGSEKTTYSGGGGAGDSIDSAGTCSSERLSTLECCETRLKGRACPLELLQSSPAGRSTFIAGVTREVDCEGVVCAERNAMGGEGAPALSTEVRSGSRPENLKRIGSVQGNVGVAMSVQAWIVGKTEVRRAESIHREKDTSHFDEGAQRDGCAVSMLVLYAFAKTTTLISVDVPANRHSTSGHHTIPATRMGPWRCSARVKVIHNSPARRIAGLIPDRSRAACD